MLVKHFKIFEKYEPTFEASKERWTMHNTLRIT